MAELQHTMPPGWDCKVDERTGKHYYVNHFTKTTTWEDPRNRHRPLPGTPKQFSNVQVEHIPLQDMRSISSRMSPLTVRSSRVQDSSLTTLTDTEEAVAKVSAMFPTVSETHIKQLLRSCRYMKSVFPQADEIVILEILQNNDNNIQKTSDALKDMGFTKKTIKPAQRKADATQEERQDNVNEVQPATPKPRVRTLEEKTLIKEKLQYQYKDVAEQLITIALESVNFDESRANQILQITLQEDTEAANSRKKDEEEITVADSVSKTNTISVPNLPVSQSRQSIKSLLKSEKNDKEINIFTRKIDGNDVTHKSSNLLNTSGHNPGYTKGANEKLLLEDYVKWQGSNSSIRKGPQGLANGPNRSLLSNRSYKPCGPNADLRKGPKFGLSKGSIFLQLKTVLVGEK